jgi:hypothetical protein
MLEAEQHKLSRKHLPNRPWSIEYILLTIVPRASFIYCILAIELMLRWNRVTGVYTVSSTGQLIPLVTGVVGFLDVLFNVQGKYEVRTVDFVFFDCKEGRGRLLLLTYGMHGVRM